MNERAAEIDITKGLLTLGMVLAHVTQFLGDGRSRVLGLASQAINLGTFSGFLFCFGFAFWMAYLRPDTLPWRRVLVTALKCHLAFVISGTAFRVLVGHAPFSANLVLRVAAARDIPDYSEFLLSFSVVTVLCAVFSRAVRYATHRLQALAGALVICLAFTMLPDANRYDPWLGQLIGGRGFWYFPTVQYLPLFLAGVFVARHGLRFDWRWGAVALAGVAVFAGLSALKIPISRCPPSAVWVLCSACLAYLYHGAACWIASAVRGALPRYLAMVGRNVLLYLLLSNLVLFVCVALGLRGSLAAWQVLGFYVVLMGGVLYMQGISTELRSVERMGR